MVDNNRLAYIAGLVDGEGYIGIKKDQVKGRGVNPVFYERISVASNNKDIIDFISDFFAVGKIYLHKHSKLSKKCYWSWEASNLKAVEVIKKIYRFLRIKKPEADLVLELSRNKIKKYGTLPKEVVEYREKLYQGIKDIHN